MGELQSTIAYAKAFGVFIVAVGFALAGWNSLLQSKIKSITALWHWKDEFVKEYAKDRLADAKEYATKRELTRAIDRLESTMEEMDRKLDKLLLRGG